MHEKLCLREDGRIPKIPNQKLELSRVRLAVLVTVEDPQEY
jgi:hypothetical protein